MFSLRNPEQQIAIYAEWMIFVVLVAALIGLWWLIEFGATAGFLSHQIGGQPGSISDAVINKLITGETAPQTVPLAVTNALSASKTSSVAATSVPAEVIQSLTPHN